MPVLLAVVVAVGTGCSPTYRASFVIPADWAADARVYGDAPFVQVSNSGPGTVTVTFDDGDRGEARVKTVPPNLTVGRTLRGSRMLWLQNDSDSAAEVSLVAQRATGLDFRGGRPVRP
jgi:hypothetical protein